MNSDYNRSNYNSVPIGFQHGSRFYSQRSPSIQQGNRFPSPHNRFRSPNNSNYVSFNRSPMHGNQTENYSPRNSSPFHHNFHRSTPNSPSSPDSWNNRANRSSYGSGSSGSYFGDVSFGSPHNTPSRNNRFQGKRGFQSPNSSDSNPGHSADIRQYVHSSMLEDPWKELMAGMNKNNEK